MKTILAAVGILLSASFLQSSSAADANERPVKDLSRSNSEIHWPKGFDPKEADAFSHNEIRVDATASVIWANLVDAKSWPVWYSNASDIQFGNSDKNALEAEATFSWRTFGFPVQSKINEFVPCQRIGWFGSAAGITAYHTWLIVAKAGGCEVITEESQVGPASIKYNIEQPTAMHDGHNWWLNALKYRSEHSASKQ